MDSLPGGWSEIVSNRLRSGGGCSYSADRIEAKVNVPWVNRWIAGGVADSDVGERRAIACESGGSDP